MVRIQRNNCCLAIEGQGRQEGRGGQGRRREGGQEEEEPLQAGAVRAAEAGDQGGLRPLRHLGLGHHRGQGAQGRPARARLRAHQGRTARPNWQLRQGRLGPHRLPRVPRHHDHKDVREGLAVGARQGVRAFRPEQGRHNILRRVEASRGGLGRGHDGRGAEGDDRWREQGRQIRRCQ